MLKPDIPDLSEKVMLVTGGTNGLGRESVLGFAAHNPAYIYFTGRSQSSADSLIQEVRTTFPNVEVAFIPCDLASFESIQNAASNLLSRSSRLDIVLANAGVMALPHGQTEDGYEIQFGTNHMGHALLVKLLVPLLEATAKMTGDVRIVWNTSLGYGLHPRSGVLFDKVKTPQQGVAYVGGRWILYGQSKLANLLYARSFAKHNPSIVSVSIHPGVAATGLVTSLGILDRLIIYATNIGKMISPEQCAWNQQWAATAPIGKGPQEVESGTYYEPVGVRGKLAYEAGNDELAEQLWNWTQQEIEGYTI